MKDTAMVLPKEQIIKLKLLKELALDIKVLNYLELEYYIYLIKL